MDQELCWVAASLTCLGREKQRLLAYMYDGALALCDNFRGAEKHLPLSAPFFFL